MPNPAQQCQYAVFCTSMFLPNGCMHSKKQQINPHTCGHSVYNIHDIHNSSTPKLPVHQSTSASYKLTGHENKRLCEGHTSNVCFSIEVTVWGSCYICECNVHWLTLKAHTELRAKMLSTTLYLCVYFISPVQVLLKQDIYLPVHKSNSRFVNEVR